MKEIVIKYRQLKKYKQIKIRSLQVNSIQAILIIKEIMRQINIKIFIKIKFIRIRISNINQMKPFILKVFKVWIYKEILIDKTFSKI